MNPHRFSGDRSSVPHQSGGVSGARSKVRQGSNDRTARSGSGAAFRPLAEIARGARAARGAADTISEKSGSLAAVAVICLAKIGRIDVLDITGSLLYDEPITSSEEDTTS